PARDPRPARARGGRREGRGGGQRGACLHHPCPARAAADLPGRHVPRPRDRADADHAGDARRRLPRADGEGAPRLMVHRAFIVLTYVQRLLLFDAPDFVFGAETVAADEAHVATEVVTSNDRFAVDYTLRLGPAGWRATDIVVEGVSLAQNFRAQFDAAVARDSFHGLLER